MEGPLALLFRFLADSTRTVTLCPSLLTSFVHGLGLRPGLFKARSKVRKVMSGLGDFVLQTSNLRYNCIVSVIYFKLANCDDSCS